MAYLGYIFLYLIISVLLVFLLDLAWQYSKRTLTHPIDKRLTTTRTQSSVACKHQPCWSLLFDMQCPLGDACPFDHGEDAIEALRPPAGIAPEDNGHTSKTNETHMKNELNDFLSTIIK